MRHTRKSVSLSMWGIVAMLAIAMALINWLQTSRSNVRPHTEGIVVERDAEVVFLPDEECRVISTVTQFVENRWSIRKMSICSTTLGMSDETADEWYREGKRHQGTSSKGIDDQLFISLFENNRRTVVVKCKGLVNEKRKFVGRADISAMMVNWVGKWRQEELVKEAVLIASSPGYSQTARGKLALVYAMAYDSKGTGGDWLYLLESTNAEEWTVKKVIPLRIQ